MSYNIYVMRMASEKEMYLSFVSKIYVLILENALRTGFKIHPNVRIVSFE